MILVLYLWLLMCHAHYSGGDHVDDYELTTYQLKTRDDIMQLPIPLGQDTASGCICRTSNDRTVIVCFGNYLCQKFPEIKERSLALRVRTTNIISINKRQLDPFHYLEVLQIEANHKLKYLEPGLFRNMTNLQQLSISYNTGLHTISKRTFEGLINLRNLTLVNNGFTNILQLTLAFRLSILPSLRSLDLSENSFEEIPEITFLPMEGTLLNRLEFRLCRLDFIHPRSFLPLKQLKELQIGENDLDASLIESFLLSMWNEGINITFLDLSGMGFRKKPPKTLLEVIANTTIKKLDLSQNQFEIIHDDSFPQMVNIEVLDLRKVFAIQIGPNAFDPYKFPNLKVLLLGSNNLPGVHGKHLSTQLLFLDLSRNSGTDTNPMYFEVDRDTFIESNELRVLDFSYNRIKSLFNYSFTGLDKLKILNMENGTIFYIGPGTFKTTKRLQLLNLENNPIAVNENLTSPQFVGLNELQILILTNCGIKYLYDDDNIFEMMPNLTHLILRNNQLYYITAETLKPLKFLQVLDLAENLLLSWWKPLFLAAGVSPSNLYLTNNKISHFTLSMVQDISYLLENNAKSNIDIMDNVFVCDCSAMYKIYLWMEVNASMVLKEYFSQSNFQCSSPDLWEDRRVADYLSSIKSLQCYVYEKISNMMVLVWTGPTLLTAVIIGVMITLIRRYKMWLRYWIFLVIHKNNKSLKNDTVYEKEYKYDAFVSYCNEDSVFVSEMLTQLELNPPYLKLCVYERDFEVGSFICESVLSSINDSRYVILIISNNFAKSKWCRWEAKFADFDRCTEGGISYDPLILVKLGEVEYKYVTKTLCFLLKTKVYLSWDENHPGDFWKKLRNVLHKNVNYR